MVVQQIASELANNPKVATATAGATASAGMGTMLEWIPGDIGKLATVIGIILSTVLIINHYRRGKLINIDVENAKLQHEKLQLEIDKLKKG